MHAVERRREAGVRDQALPSAIVRIEGIITHLAMRVPSARRPSSMAAPGRGDSLRRVLGNRLLIRQGFVLERGWMRHGNDVVAGIHEVNVTGEDRKSTRLNSSHTVISYAVFCLKKKKPTTRQRLQ